MDKNRKLLSDIVIHTKYAKYIDGRRETWDEIVDRTFEMHRETIHYRFRPKVVNQLMEYLSEAEALVRAKLVMPSMRSLQFSGKPILEKNERLYNCSYLPIYTMMDIHDLFTLCMVGCGVGFSVFDEIAISERSGIEIPVVVEDSVEGWSKSVYALLMSYKGGPNFTFDYSAIRPEGALIKSIGSFAPGPHVLERTHVMIREIVERRLNGNPLGKLRTIDIFDICCILGDAATCGGTRRSALITFFDHKDEEMLSAKHGPFWETKPYRSRANISATFNRTNRDYLQDLHSHYLEYLGTDTGEPGVFITNCHGWFSNPCAEISLQPYSFCNLTSLNAAECLKDDKLFFSACDSATFLGTIQSLYTNFKLVDPRFQENAEWERLLGVSMTGLAAHYLKDCEGLILRGAKSCEINNRFYAEMMGINPAHRITCIKPEGSTSAVMGTSSGVHPEESRYYIRNVRIDRNRGLVKHLQSIDYPFLEPDAYNASDMVVGIPMESIGAVNDHKDAFSLVDDIVLLNRAWINPGHSRGSNPHNVSTTLRVRKEDVSRLADKLMQHVKDYTAVAYLPASDVVYPQAPFQEIDASTYHKIKDIPEIDLNKVVETFVSNEYDSACSGGKCEIN